jgi:hypothetical protein
MNGLGREQWGGQYPLGLLALVLGGLTLGAAVQSPHPMVVISHHGQTLRLQWDDPSVTRRVFPVGLARQAPGQALAPLGTFFTGPAPDDSTFYLSARQVPAFYGGLPFLRLVYSQGQQRYPFALHGPITPTLIWGPISAGCVRLRPEDLRELYQVAVRYPSMPVTFLAGPDRLEDHPVELDRRPELSLACPESKWGIRRLSRLGPGHEVHDRLCGNIDHWYAIELKGGDALSVQVQHAGSLWVELYGPRAISIIAEGRFGLEFSVPCVQRNRADRYLRITARKSESAKERSAVIPYGLKVAP